LHAHRRSAPPYLLVKYLNLTLVTPRKETFSILHNVNILGDLTNPKCLRV
jgi:hypothetical protein